VTAKYILAVLAVAFFAGAFMRMSRADGTAHPQTKTWLLVGVIFAVVSGWLFARG
jgi:hypothetical protein